MFAGAVTSAGSKSIGTSGRCLSTITHTRRESERSTHGAVPPATAARKAAAPPNAASTSASLPLASACATAGSPHDAAATEV